MKKILLLALLGVLFFGSAFGNFVFTDLFTPIGRILVGGYFAFMAYQVLSPYPVVIETNLLPERIAGVQTGPLIAIDKDMKEGYKNQVVAHEREHLFQEAAVNFCAAAIVRAFEYVRAFIEGDAYKYNMWETLANRAELKYANEGVMLYWKLEIEF